MITTKQKICCIRRYSDQEMEWNNFTPSQRFKLIIAKIKRVSYGIRKNTVTSDKFYPLEIEELESNTSMINKETGLLLVNEPFVIDESEIPYYEEVVKRWNEDPPKSLWEENINDN